jgi:hypothetical protein
MAVTSGAGVRSFRQALSATPTPLQKKRNIAHTTTHSHRLAKDPRFERLPCSHKGTYADDCIVERVTQVRSSFLLFACLCVSVDLCLGGGGLCDGWVGVLGGGEGASVEEAVCIVERVTHTHTHTHTFSPSSNTAPLLRRRHLRQEPENQPTNTNTHTHTHPLSHTHLTHTHVHNHTQIISTAASSWPPATKTSSVGCARFRGCPSCTWPTASTRLNACRRRLGRRGCERRMAERGGRGRVGGRRVGCGLNCVVCLVCFFGGW